MKDSEPFFIDSNVLIYGYYGQREKSEKLDAILRQASLPVIISTQVVKEFCNVCLKKRFSNTNKELIERLEWFYRSLVIAEISLSTLKEAVSIHERYGYSFYDSLIIAAALEQGCKTLYSEDLHHGQTIQKKLKIINPFAK